MCVACPTARALRLYSQMESEALPPPVAPVNHTFCGVPRQWSLLASSVATAGEGEVVSAARVDWGTGHVAGRCARLHHPPSMANAF